MDNYQAVYDAVRSKFGYVDGEAIVRAACEAFDISHAKAMLQEQIFAVGAEMARPSVIWRPKVYRDGNQWCALYGDDLMMGVAGFGDTPDLACHAFDKAWHEKIPPVMSKDQVMAKFDQMVTSLKS